MHAAVAVLVNTVKNQQRFLLKLTNCIIAVKIKAKKSSKINGFEKFHNMKFVDC